MDHLVLRNIGKKIRGQSVLEDISFSLPRGQVLGIVGPDGAGKSSLLKIIAGVWQCDQGDLTLNGETFKRLPQDFRSRVGFMSFAEGLYQDLTGPENLQYAAALYNLSPEKVKPRIDWLLKKTGMVSFEHLPVKAYSGGMKQKLALCCALIHEPEILLLDEPSTGVDPVSRRQFWDLLFDLPHEDVSIIITTPYFEEISRCNRILLLSQGKILLAGEPQGLYDRSKWKAMDLFPDRMLAALEVLDRKSQVSSYRIKGHAIHVLLPNQEGQENKIVGDLEGSGISLNDYKETSVELEDLFYLNIHSESKTRKEEQVLGGSLISEVRTLQQAAIKAENLKKSFGEIEAVKGIDLQIQAGEILGVIGSNGAGKTTLLRMLCGLLRPDRGRLEILGKDPWHQREEIISEISYMSQEFSLYRDLSVEENILFYGGIYGLEGSELQGRLESVLQITALEEHRRQKVRELPTGWKQRLSLGCSLVHDPTILFLDEPTSGVDPISRRHLWHWITYLAEKGKTVIVTTHYMTEAEQCHRVMLMHEGNVLTQGSPEKICQADNKSGALFELECLPIRPAIQALKGISWIRSVVPYGNNLHILTTRGRENLPDLKGLLSKEGVHLQYLSPIPYSIEDVFLEEIGKGLWEEY